MFGASSIDYSQAEINSFVHRVYNWMALGLAVTGAVSLYMAAHPAMILQLMRNSILFWGLLIMELGLVFALAGWVQRMSSGTAALAFLFYAALNGVTMSSIFLIYTSSSIANAFFVTAGTFAVMSVWGYTTKKDLTSMGHLLFMALIGLIIASVVNIFLHSPAMRWIAAYAGVVIFTGLVAYDTQKIKGLFNPGEDSETESKEAVSGALALYLDFINLFLELVQIMGQGREE